ncbi:phosphopantetheine-binding protein [Actinophytocola sp.]|uniref:phosphopantetheine-binding protein n=1 Tax=Actinophytocola sp. TaxID=1872138 RepID=UPI0025C047F7|nr:phosphopantetheine-binding protein [Actinophytocola sp.]
MSEPALDRKDVVAMVASFGDRPVDEVGERIDSIQLAWLVHQVEQRYGVQIELDDAQFGRMSTITGAVDVLREKVMVVEDA